ncbi:hypothetical protein Z043_111967 [Scleropages formosus]|uniref:Uncharacterized protein n=1 Tax=Scleropages formosus TaxID=113540 RepID=A0A0P7UHM7_SCLFO|nr:hypothetical protein Z043_111967 [Scleropages formosus]
MLERVESELREATTLGHSVAALLRSLRADMDRTLQGSTEAVEEAFDCEALVQTEALLGERVTGGVVQAWSRVQKKLQQFISREGLSSSAVGTDQEKLLAQLEAELEQNKQLVRMQQELLEDSVHPLLPPALADSYYLEEWERLQLKWAEFEDQRRSFQRERQAFTDAAIRLGRERCQFEQKKASLLRQQFLCHSPCVQQRRESSTMSIAPWSEQTPVGTPSTPELFSALRLSPGPRSPGTPSCSHCGERSAHRVLGAPGDLNWSF